jgi:hypothetical protein
MLWLVVVGAAFLGGMRLGERRGWERRELEHKAELERAALLARVSLSIQADIGSAFIRFTEENTRADPLDGLSAQRKAREADETLRRALEDSSL